MFDSIFIVFALLFTKHWYIDFVNQSDEEVKGKGIYGNAHGLMHSIKHGLATAVIMYLFIDDFTYSIVLGLIDFAIHYHVDYCKMRFGNRDITTKAFWAQLGADQLAHSLSYLLIVWLVV